MNMDTLVHVKPDEKIIFALRRHAIVIIGTILLIILLGLIPFGAWFLLAANWPAVLTGTITGPTLKLLASAYYLWIWLFLFSNFVDYYLDIWIVTDDRVLNIEQQGLFNRTVSELDLANIQDVTSEVRGILPYVFGYGDVYIQTAAEQSRFIFEQIPQPDEIRKRLLVLVEEDKKKQAGAVETKRE